MLTAKLVLTGVKGVRFQGYQTQELLVRKVCFLISTYYLSILNSQFSILNSQYSILISHYIFFIVFSFFSYHSVEDAS